MYYIHATVQRLQGVKRMHSSNSMLYRGCAMVRAMIGLAQTGRAGLHAPLLGMEQTVQVVYCVSIYMYIKIIRRHIAESVATIAYIHCLARKGMAWHAPVDCCCTTPEHVLCICALASRTVY